MMAREISTCGWLESKLECFTCKGLHLWKRLRSQIGSCGTFAGRGILYTNKGKISYLNYSQILYWIPAFQNTFSSLAPFGFSFFDMLVLDFMHEFELGIWKALFTHLVCILVSHGDGTIQEFNRWYRQVPTFGRSTIRCFSENASGMKKLAARNFEDLLQVRLRMTWNLDYF